MQDSRDNCLVNVCSVCCVSIMCTLAICANIIGFVGLSHTRLIDLEPYCPHNYWEGSLTLIFMRFLVYSVAIGLMACSRHMSEDGANGCCIACVTLLSMMVILSVAVSDTVITSDAISALNCTTALRNHGRDNDALLTVSGALYMTLDWIVLVGVCCTCLVGSRTSAEISPC
jgi:hypothetical protein